MFHILISKNCLKWQTYLLNPHEQWANSSWPDEVIFHQSTGSSLDQIMAWCRHSHFISSIHIQNVQGFWILPGLDLNFWYYMSCWIGGFQVHLCSTYLSLLDWRKLVYLIEWSQGKFVPVLSDKSDRCVTSPNFNFLAFSLVLDGQTKLKVEPCLYLRRQGLNDLTGSILWLWMTSQDISCHEIDRDLISWFWLWSWNNLR